MSASFKGQTIVLSGLMPLLCAVIQLWCDGSSVSMYYLWALLVHCISWLSECYWASVSHDI